jgi:hypothetical protein
MKYTTDKPCPTCGITETWETKAGPAFVYSCAHFAYKSQHPSCKYCGKSDTPVRQVPAPLPFSDCYCDDCWDKARDEYILMAVQYGLADVKTLVALDLRERRLKEHYAEQLADPRLAAKLHNVFEEARKRLARLEESG